MFIVYVLEADGKPVKAGRFAVRRFSDELAEKTCLKYYQSNGVEVDFVVKAEVEDNNDANKYVQRLEAEIYARRKAEEQSIRRRKIQYGDGYPKNAFIEIRNGALIRVRV